MEEQPLCALEQPCQTLLCRCRSRWWLGLLCPLCGGHSLLCWCRHPTGWPGPVWWARRIHCKNQGLISLFNPSLIKPHLSVAANLQIFFCFTQFRNWSFWTFCCAAIWARSRWRGPWDRWWSSGWNWRPGLRLCRQVKIIFSTLGHFYPSVIFDYWL